MMSNTNTRSVTIFAVAVTVVCSLCIGQPAFASWFRELTAGEVTVDPNTNQNMLVIGYDGGRLEFRDWQGNVIATRTGFGEITTLEAYRCSGSPLPRLFVGSTDSGGALRVIDPANINNDLAMRSGLGRITALNAWVDCIYVGSSDSGGTLRKLNNITLADEDEEAVRSGFGEVTALADVWVVDEVYLLVASTDSGGTLRIINPDTLSDVGSARTGFDRIYALATDDIDWDGTAEIVVASSDEGGTVRYIEADDLFVDKAVRSGFATVYDVEYGLLGVDQCNGNGKASIVVASSKGTGVIHVMEVDIGSMSTMLADSAVRSGFGKVATIGIADLYNTGIGVLKVFSTGGHTMAVHLTDENLTGLTIKVVGPIIPTFAIKQLRVRAGKTTGLDRIRVSGTIDIIAADIANTNNMHINIWSADDADGPVYSESINLHPGMRNKNMYIYKRRVRKGEPGGITFFALNLKRHRFLFRAKNIDLTGLSCPLSVEIEVGSYLDVGQADEAIVNGKKPIPMQLMSGYADTLRVDKLIIRSGRNPSSDLLSVKGAFALRNAPDTIGEVVITLGTQDFTIPGSSFYTTKGAWVCKNAEVIEGGLASAKFDPVKCSFIITINNADIETKSGTVDFGISAFGSFNQTVKVNLP